MKLRDLITKSILSITAVAVAATGIVLPQAAPAVAETERTIAPFGVASHPMWGTHYSSTDIDTELSKLAAMGARWIRFDISWRYIERVKDTYDTGALARLDRIVSGAKARGIEPQVTIIETPDWANGGAGMFTPPTSMSDYANFVRDMVARYAGRVTYWEIWNEPNLHQFWEPVRDPVKYTAMLKVAYLAAKQANPNCKIISAGLAGNDVPFLQAMYNAGVKGYFDLLGVHPYSGERSPYDDSGETRWNFGGMAEMKKVMDNNGDTGKHISASEFGWATGSFYQGITEAQQGDYVKKAYERLINEFPYVDNLMVYNARNNGTDPNHNQDNFGLMRQDFSAKPAYNAYKSAVDNFWSAITLRAGTTSVNYGGNVTMSVKVTPIGQTPVTLQKAVSGVWQDVETATTTAQGTAAISAVPTATAVYRAVAAERGLTSTSMTVKVRAKVTIRTSRRVVRRLRPITVAGRVLPGRRTTVVLQSRRGGRWATARRIRTSTLGSYRTTLRVRRRGAYAYRIKYYGNSSHLGTTSRPTPLRVY